MARKTSVTCDRCGSPGQEGCFVTFCYPGDKIGENLDLCPTCLTRLAQRLVAKFTVGQQAEICDEFKERDEFLGGRKVVLLPKGVHLESVHIDIDEGHARVVQRTPDAGRIGPIVNVPDPGAARDPSLLRAGDHPF